MNGEKNNMQDAKAAWLAAKCRASECEAGKRMAEIEQCQLLLYFARQRLPGLEKFFPLLFHKDGPLGCIPMNRGEKLEIIEVMTEAMVKAAGGNALASCWQRCCEAGYDALIPLAEKIVRRLNMQPRLEP